MKKILYLAFVAIAALAMNACKSNSEPTPPDEQKQDTTKVESIKGSITTPSWTNPEGYNMTSSMTAIVKVDLAQSFSADQLVEGGYQPSTSDKLAAFDATGNCLGVAEQTDGLYFLYITAPENDSQVAIRYYSVTLKNIFISTKTFAFRNDDNLGTVAEPYAPTFEVDKK